MGFIDALPIFDSELTAQCNRGARYGFFIIQRSIDTTPTIIGNQECKAATTDLCSCRQHDGCSLIQDRCRSREHTKRLRPRPCLLFRYMYLSVGQTGLSCVGCNWVNFKPTLRWVDSCSKIWATLQDNLRATYNRIDSWAPSTRTIRTTNTGLGTTPQTRLSGLQLTCKLANSITSIRAEH